MSVRRVYKVFEHDGPHMESGMACELTTGVRCVIGLAYGGARVHIIDQSADGWHPTEAAAVAAYLGDLERYVAGRRAKAVALLTPEGS